LETDAKEDPSFSRGFCNAFASSIKASFSAIVLFLCLKI